VKFDVEWYKRLSPEGKAKVDGWMEGVGFTKVTCVELVDESGCRGTITVLDMDASRQERAIVSVVMPDQQWSTRFPVGAS
jgi:hypothetical protein